MTEKLYYQDAYISEFTATVTSCNACEAGYLLTLDKTAFFPEEGGQSADRGVVADAHVKDVTEQDEEILHLIDKPLSVGAQVCGKIDFDERFEKMQIHTAEHIACGIINKLYGYDNVGFHLGAEVVTFDISAPMTREMLDTVEGLANRIVWQNLPVTASFPSKEELVLLEYRSKLSAEEGVRIVTVEGVDVCACCAPHVARTGEIGIIKFLDFERLRGGTRIYMTAGSRALTDYRERYSSVKSISALTSEPQASVVGAVEALIRERDTLKYEIKKRGLAFAAALADVTAPIDTVGVYELDGFTAEELREFSNIMCAKSAGLIVSLAKGDGDVKYVIAKKDTDIAPIVKAANTQLFGRGGGRGGMAQGSFRSEISAIRRYFEESEK